MEKFDLQKETFLLLAGRVINYFDCTKYVDWAIKALENGHESENLYVIAGLDHEYEEVVDSYFKLAIQELKLKIDFEDSTIYRYAKYICEEVIKGEINAEKGLSILTKVYFVSDYNGKYLAFSNLADDINYLGHDEYTIYNSGLSKENKGQYIIDECKLFIEMQDMVINDEITKYVYCENCQKIGIAVLKKDNEFFQKTNTWRCSHCNSKEIYFFEDQIGKKKILASLK